MQVYSNTFIKIIKMKFYEEPLVLVGLLRPTNQTQLEQVVNTCMHAHTHTHTHTHNTTHTDTHTYTYVYIYVFMYIYIYVIIHI